MIYSLITKNRFLKSPKCISTWGQPLFSCLAPSEAPINKSYTPNTLWWELILFFILKDLNFQITHQQLEQAKKLSTIWVFCLFVWGDFLAAFLIRMIPLAFMKLQTEYFILAFITYPDAIAIKHKTISLKFPFPANILKFPVYCCLTQAPCPPPPLKQIALPGFSLWLPRGAWKQGGCGPPEIDFSFLLLFVVICLLQPWKLV